MPLFIPPEIFARARGEVPVVVRFVLALAATSLLGCGGVSPGEWSGSFFGTMSSGLGQGTQDFYAEVSVRLSESGRDGVFDVSGEWNGARAFDSWSGEIRGSVGRDGDLLCDDYTDPRALCVSIHEPYHIVGIGALTGRFPIGSGAGEWAFSSDHGPRGEGVWSLRRAD